MIRRVSGSGMKWDTIACLEDLLRVGVYLPEAFCDWAREPIRQGAGFDIASAPVGGRRHNLMQDLDLEKFFALVRAESGDAAWDRHHQRIPAVAGDYLMRHVPEATLILAMELPPWLRLLCEERDVPYIDLRVSPLRFARDLYVAMRTNDRSMFERMRPFAVPDDECRLEAATMAASIRCHQRSLRVTGRHDFSLGRSLVFIGQVATDAAVIAADGTVLRCAMFADQLRALDDGRRLWYKPHPYAGAFADEERAVLAEIFGRDAETCMQNVYQILSSNEDVHLVALTSGVLQEAAYFGKSAHSLHGPATPIAADEDAHEDGGYLQIRFEDYLAPMFWHAVLAPQRPAPRVPRLPAMQPNQFREGLGLWWDYSKHVLWERPFWVEAFVRSGGGALQNRVSELERRLGEEDAS